MKNRNRFKKAALVLIGIRIILISFSLFTMSNGRIPCDFTRKECTAYGSLSKNGTVIKYDNENDESFARLFKMRQQVFEMSDEDFNKYWSETHQ